MTAEHAVFAHHGERLLYRVGEAAELLGISRSKAWELLARGEIESVKIDGARRVSRGAIEAYVARLAGGGGAA
jgi:excisionase family DNA binding protein